MESKLITISYKIFRFGVFVLSYLFFCFLCKYIYFLFYANIQIVICTEYEIGMYYAYGNVSLLINWGGSHFFFHLVLIMHYFLFSFL